MTNGAHSVPVVLVVEDNELLKFFMVNLVRLAGFTAIPASNADEALAILESRSDIALLITNVVMRDGMNGVSLAHAVDKRWPSVKIIVVSDLLALSECDLPMKSLFFTKPYHDEEMLFEIRSLIDPQPG